MSIFITLIINSLSFLSDAHANSLVPAPQLSICAFYVSCDIKHQEYLWVLTILSVFHCFVFFALNRPNDYKVNREDNQPIKK